MLQALLLVFVVTLVTRFVIQRRRRLSLFKDIGIPGPPPSFLAGNLSEMIHKGTLVAYKEWMEEYGDLVGFYNGAHPFLIVKDPELIKKIQIKDFHNFYNRGMASGFERSHPVFKDNVINAEGHRWKRIRGLLRAAFTTRNMKQMVGLMDDSIDDFLDVVGFMGTKEGSIEFRELFQRLTADVIIRSAFGLKSDLLQKYRTKSTTEPLFRECLNLFQQFRQSWIYFLTACFPEFTPLLRMIISWSTRHKKTAVDRIIEEITPIIQFRRDSPESQKGRCDLLQLMLDAELKDEDLANVHSLTASADDEEPSKEKPIATIGDSGKKLVLKTSEVQANAFTLFIAGFETTGSSMASLSYLLAKHQDIQDRLREEVLVVLDRDGEFRYDNVLKIKYLDQVICESLRLMPPLLGFTNRSCVRDYVHKGMTIPAGTSILILHRHMGHDPAFWEEPEKFDPERFSPENRGRIDPAVYQPFGQGPRNCVGMRFAQLEMKLTTAKLLAKYKLFLDDRHIKEKELEHESTFNLVYPKNGIWLKVEKISK